MFPAQGQTSLHNGEQSWPDHYFERFYKLELSGEVNIKPYIQPDT